MNDNYCFIRIYFYITWPVVFHIKNSGHIICSLMESLLSNDLELAAPQLSNDSSNNLDCKKKSVKIHRDTLSCCLFDNGKNITNIRIVFVVKRQHGRLTSVKSPLYLKG